MTKSDGKWFEEKTSNEFSKLHAGTEVEVYPSEHLRTIYGDTQQVDVHIKNHPVYDFIIFECKDEGKIGKRASRQAEGIMKDVGAKHAAIVGNGRFTAPLIKRCRHYGIELLHVIDTEEERLRTTVRFEVVTGFTWISQYRCHGVFGENVFDLEYPPTEIRSEYSNESLHQMLSTLWNEGALKKEPRKHEYLRDKFELLTSPDHGLLRQAVDGVQFEYIVTQKFFLHEVPIANGSGVLDVLKNQLTLTSPILSVGPMKIEDFAIDENEITSKEAEEKSNLVAFVGEATYVMT